MAQGIVALEPAEVISRGPIGQAIGVAGGDVEGIEDPQAIFEIWHRFTQGGRHKGREIPQRPAQAMAPLLLPMMQVQAFESFLHGLMAGKASPFVVASGGAHPRQLQIGPGLMQPISGTVHAVILALGCHLPMPPKAGPAHPLSSPASDPLDQAAPNPFPPAWPTRRGPPLHPRARPPPASFNTAAPAAIPSKIG